jgi:ribose transport system ATP-binding protein
VANEPARLAVRGLRKSFGPNLVLDDVDLTIAPGEVHGLLGQNGSGKSTLIKVLAGFHGADAGTLEIDGREVELPLPPGRPGELGLNFVHQDLGLIGSLSVLDNLFLSHRVDGPRIIRNRSERDRASELLHGYGLDIDVMAPIDRLRPVQRAQVAIVRAVSALLTSHEKGGVLVLDEPTVYLSQSEVDELFELVEEASNRGTSVLFVSHDLDEVRQITETITVLRDGQRVGCVPTASIDHDDLVELIVGRRVVFGRRRSDVPTERSDRPLCSVKGLGGGFLHGLDLDVRPGEIVGLAGTAGSGFEDVPYLLFGAEPATADSFEFDGTPVDITRHEPLDSIRLGLAFIPADRAARASIGSLTVSENIMMASQDDFVRRGVLRRRAMAREARTLVERFDVRPPDPDKLFATLSGGNQQKAVLAKWLRKRPQILLLHEPTQGVDAGARRQIYDTLLELASEGMSVICASSDHEELAELCERVVVVAAGRQCAVLVGSEVTKEEITHACLMGSRSAA